MGKRATAVSVAIAAAGAADDDAVLRRRVQYKIYQRQHRARQKNKTLRLEHEVAALSEEIARLAAQHAALATHNRGVFASRGTLLGEPARAVDEFYRVFAHGHDPARAEPQAQFMRAIMASDVQGPDFDGVETLIDQWAIYGDFFQRTHYGADDMRIECFDDVTVVVVDVVMTIQPSRDGALQLYPTVRGDEHTLQQLVAAPFDVHGSVRFVFDAETGKVSWFGADMDFLRGLITVLGSAQRVSRCIEQAKMSLCTGRIATVSEPALRRQCEKSAFARRGLDHLLC